MANKKRTSATPPARTNLPLTTRVVLAFTIPLLAAAVVGTLIGSAAEQTARAPLLGAIGLASWFLGLWFYGLPAVGLRGKRPLFAGIGFATLGWGTFLLLRAIFIPLNPEPAGSTRAFIYLLLFESFAIQLWAFGLLFRALADWRGPLTAAVAGGIVFGATAVLWFQNSGPITVITLIYYTTWGLFYGIIRLRTGSLLGAVFIQAMQSFTAWVALGALPADIPVSQLQWVFGLATVAYAVFTWRLWPQQESDYRV